MKESLEISEVFSASPAEIYEAWLSSEGHTEMTGGEATCDDEVGSEFTAWDGYITGKNVSFEPNQLIVQKWRTSEFPEGDEDSDLIVRIEPHEEGSKVTIVHMNIPEGQTQYKQGWVEHYFEPMKSYFG